MVKNRNTLILPGIDVQADVRAINEGQAERRGMFFVINGRVYGQEPTGRLFPDHGDGFIFLGRPAMQALKILARYNGPTPQAEFQFSMDPNITPTVVEAALAAWRRRKKT